MVAATYPQAIYDIAVLSEYGLCADCVLDLLFTDPTCEEVTRYITRRDPDA